MNLDIRSHIINNFKGDDTSVLKDAIEESIIRCISAENRARRHFRSYEKQ